MRFLLFTGLLVLSQFLATEGFFVTWGALGNYKRSAEHARSDLRNRISAVKNVVDGMSNQINALVRSNAALEKLVNDQTDVLKIVKADLAREKTARADLDKRVVTLEERMDELKNLNKCALEDDMFMCMVKSCGSDIDTGVSSSLSNSLSSYIANSASSSSASSGFTGSAVAKAWSNVE